MKKLILFCVIILCQNLSAKCRSNNISVFPNGNVLKKNSILIIDGFSESQKVILGLNKQYAIYLESGNQKVKLLVKEINVGQFNLTQVLLVLEKELEVGLEYTLKIDNLPKGESLSKYNESSNKYLQYKFKVIEGIDNQKPIFTNSPKILKKEVIQFGCGPEINVIFNCPIKDDSEFLIQASVTDTKTKVTTTYYVKPYKNELKIGHDMCSGAFDFLNENFEVTFKIIDASGNSIDWGGNKISFTRPM